MPFDQTQRTALSSAALRGAFELSGDCVKVLDLAGRLLVMNAGGAAKMELPGPDALLGADWIAFWSGADRTEARRAVEQARRGGTGSFQGYLPTAKGVPKWWDSTVSPIPGPGGRPANLLVISRDVTETHRLAEALSVAGNRNNALIWAASEIVWQADARQECGEGAAWSAFTGVTTAGAGEWLGSVHPDDRDRVRRVYAQGIASGTSYVNEYRLRHVTQGWRWVVDRAMPLKDASGAVTEWIGVISDVHDRRMTELALRDSEQRLRLAVEASGVGIWDVDMIDGHRIWSAELKRIFGLAADAEASEQVLLDLVHPDDRNAVLEANRSVLVDGKDDGVTFRIVRADDGEIRWVLSKGRGQTDEQGRQRRVGTLQDITARKVAEEKIWAAANLDPLTLLSNRTLFHSELGRAVEAAGAAGHGLGLLVIDLDHFKEVNDTLGHDAGDVVLRAVGHRLAECVERGASVARLGGDEFAVLLPRISDRLGVKDAARAILQGLSSPVEYNSVELACSASIGFSVFPDDADSGSDLLKNADLALYAAKAAGRNRYARFRPALKAAMQKRVAVLRAAREALAQDAIVPFYQPKVCVASGRVTGFEALLRLRGPEGIRGPAAIAEAFDDPELAVQIGRRMLDKVVGDLRAWSAAGVQFGSVALNVSAAELSHVDVALRTLAELQAAGLPAEAMQIEVTESVFFGSETQRIAKTLEDLDAAGVEVSLDDFGTGYASLTHLQKFPVKWLKIDKSFINDIDKAGASTKIVRSVIGLSHALGMRVVAEGVETRSQFEFLERERCDLAQGYLISKPMAGTRVARFLADWRGMPVLEDCLQARAG